MVMNGLFLIALGFLLFMMWGVDPNTMSFQNPWATLLSLVLIVLGFFVFRKGTKQAKDKQSNEEKKNKK